MRHKLLLALLGVSLAFLTFHFVQPLALHHIAHAQVTATPFLLKTDLYSYEQDPDGVLINRFVQARRSDGTVVRSESILGKVGFSAAHSVRSITFMDGRRFSAYDATKVMVAWPRLPEQTLAIHKERILNPPKNCVFPGHTLKGYGILLGRTVAIVERPRVGNTQITAWDDPSLGCVDLKYQVQEVATDGSRKLLTEAKPVSLTLGEPDASLFEIAYPAMKPSEALHKEADALGVTWDDSLARFASREDSAFSAAEKGLNY